MVATCKNCDKPIKFVVVKGKFVHLEASKCKNPEPKR